MGKVQGCGQGPRVWARYKVGGNLSTCFLYTFRRVYVEWQRNRTWAKYKDVGKIQGYGQSTRMWTKYKDMIKYKDRATYKDIDKVQVGG